MISWLKSIRIAKMLRQMQEIDFRKESAMDELKRLTLSVEELIRSNRGGDKGIHGFIGERAQVYLTNAWALLNGDTKICELIDDNGMTDYLERGIKIQQKACRANGWLGLDHVLKHREKYPGFDGRYQIPKDFYEKYLTLVNMTEEEAGKLRLHDWRLWQLIQKVEQEGIKVDPMNVTYAEIQRDRIYDTINRNKDEIQDEAGKMKSHTAELHKPTAKECVATAAVSSVTEGVLAGTVKAVEKKCEGKAFHDFDNQDLKEIGTATFEGSIRGAVRGTAVYLAENYTPIPGVVAGSAVTVAFESGKAIKQCADGNITTEECVFAIERSVIVAAAGGIGAKIGGNICPIPILGEAVGGFVFSLIAGKGFDFMVGFKRAALTSAAPQPI